MINLNPCIGMRPGVSEADRQLVRWMFSQPPFDRKSHKKFFSPDFRYDPKEFQGRHYWERGFLSCVIAGAKIPPQIAPDLFNIPLNRVIFHALQELEKSGMTGIDTLITFLREISQLESAGGEEYLVDIERMIGIPSAIRGFTLGLLRLNLGAKI